MTRTLFFFTALAAILAALTAVLIRVELAYPGVSPLFLLSDGTFAAQKFDHTLRLHTGTSLLAATLLGAAMSSVALTKQAMLAKLFVWLSSLFSFGILVILALSLIPITPTGEGASSWGALIPNALHAYVPSTFYETTALDALKTTLRLDNISLDLSQIGILPAAASIFLGAYAMLSTVPAFRLFPSLALHSPQVPQRSRP